MGQAVAVQAWRAIPFVTGWNTDLLALVLGVWQCFWLGYFLLGIAAEGSLCTGADQGVPTGARLCCGQPPGGSGATGWGVSPTLDLARAGRIWLCFHCVLAMWSYRYGKAHCSLVQGFMRGNERGTDSERHGRCL